MSSIIKVDQIQLANGSTPTAADLGLNISGNVLQVVQAFSDSYFTTTSTTRSDVLTATITPSSTSNTILLLATARIGARRSGDQIIGEWAVGETVSGGSRTEFIVSAPNAGMGIHLRYINSPAAAAMFSGVSFQSLRSPNTTSSITYDIGNKQQGSMQDNWIIQPSITLMEIAG